MSPAAPDGGDRSGGDPAGGDRPTPARGGPGPTGPFDAADIGDVRARFADFAMATAEVAPTYSRLSRVVADDADVAAIVLAAPPTQRNPVLLFAAVHWLLLRGAAHPLAMHYPTVAPDAVAASTPGSTPVSRRRPGGARTDRLVDDFSDFVATHRDDLLAAVSARATQTNEVGRAAVLLPVLATIAEEAGALAWLDLGTSAGLNLAMDRWTYRWTRVGDHPGAEVAIDGHPDVVVSSDVIGPLPLPTAVPSIGWRLGLDRSPLDVRDPDDATWLLACTWPDEPTRFARLRAALDAVADDPPPVRAGDLVDDLDAALDDVPVGLHPVLTTSWVLNYLPTPRQATFLARVDAIGRRRDLDLVMMESPRVTPGLGRVLPRRLHPASVLTRMRWRRSGASMHHLATVQSHARWIDATLRRV